MKYRVVVAACLTQALVIGSMFSYGIYLKILESELGWSRTVLSGSSSVAFLVMGVFAIAGGRLNDRFGPRWVLTITGFLTGAGYVLMSIMTEPWQLLLGFGLLVGLGLSTHDVVTLSTVAAWFAKRRGAMTGIVKTGTACGQIVIPVMVTLMAAAMGWRQSLLVLGVVIGVALVVVAQWMRRPEASRSNGAGPDSVSLGGVTYQHARRTRTFRVLCAIQFCFLPALITIPLHLPAYATDLGMSSMQAATVLSLIAACSIVGRLSLGALLDRIGGKVALLLCLVPLALSLSALLLISDPSQLYWFAPVYGFAHGGLFTVISPAVAEYFGVRAHGVIFGVIVFFGTLGGAAGPVLAGYVFDQQGNYQTVFVVLMVLAGIGALLAASLRPLVAAPQLAPS